MTNHRCQVFFAISTLALMMAVPALSQSHATVHGHTLESVAGLTDPNAMNEEWQTPLMAAAANGNERAVKALIKRKANVNVGSRFGETALMYARSLPVVKLLLSAGASANDKDIYGRTPLQYAAQGADPDVVEALIKAGAYVNAKDDSGMSALTLAKLQLTCHFARDCEAHLARVQRVIDLLVKAGASPEQPSPEQP